MNREDNGIVKNQFLSLCAIRTVLISAITFHHEDLFPVPRIRELTGIQRRKRPFTICSGMNNLASSTIAFIDSGIGGLPYYFWVKSRLPAARFVYVADTANFPYGEKSEDAVREGVVRIVRILTKTYRPSLIVIACNTASVLTLTILREQFTLPFVGVVPAIKPASERTKKKKIGIIATNRTIKDHYTAALINQFAGNCNVVSLASPELVTYVEKEWLGADQKKTEKLVQEISAPFIEEEIDVLVLGCTHFLFLRDAFQKVLGGPIEIIDSLEGVGQQVLRLWKTTEKVIEEKVIEEKVKGKDIIHITGEKFHKEVFDTKNHDEWHRFFKGFFPKGLEQADFGGSLS